MDETQVYKPIPYTGYEPPVVTERVFPSQETREKCSVRQKNGDSQVFAAGSKTWHVDQQKSGWWWKMMEFVSWDDDIPNCFWKVIKFHGSKAFQSTNQKLWREVAKMGCWYKLNGTWQRLLAVSRVNEVNTNAISGTSFGGTYHI